MATTIPVPIEFSLPDGWQPAPPDEVGAPQAAFVALHPGRSQGFTANITIAGEVYSAETSLTDVADEGVAKLESVATNVQLGNREETGTADNPGLTQAVRFDVEVKGQTLLVYQLQVFIGMEDVTRPDRRAVIQAVLTATEEQFPQVIDDFHKFVETVQPDEGNG